MSSKRRKITLFMFWARSERKKSKLFLLKRLLKFDSITSNKNKKRMLNSKTLKLRQQKYMRVSNP